MADEVRLLADWDGKISAIFKAAVTDRDGSLYIFPYSKTNRYSGGVVLLGRQEERFETTINLDDQLTLSEAPVPKISIHQSGQVHAQIAEHRLGPMRMGDLTTFQDEHIASISVDQFAGLPAYTKKLKIDGSGSTRDVVMRFDKAIPSTRFAIFVNGVSDKFSQPCNVRLSLQRPGLTTAIHFCISVIPQGRLDKDLGETDDANPGITAISGWDISKMKQSEETDFLFIRGQ